MKTKKDNIIRKIFINLLLEDVDFNSETISDIYNLITSNLIAQNYINEDDIHHFEFVVVKLDDGNDNLLIKGGNLISALWLSGIFPYNPQTVFSETEFKDNNKTYIFKEGMLETKLNTTT